MGDTVLKDTEDSAPQDTGCIRLPSHCKAKEDLVRLRQPFVFSFHEVLRAVMAYRGTSLHSCDLEP
jgi:hypothetical protein